MSASRRSGPDDHNFYKEEPPLEALEHPISLIYEDAPQWEWKSDDKGAKALSRKIRKLEEKKRKLLRETRGNESHQCSSRQGKEQQQQVEVPLRKINYQLLYKPSLQTRRFWRSSHYEDGTSSTKLYLMAHQIPKAFSIGRTIILPDL